VKRFREFLGKKLDTDRARDEDSLSKWGIKVRYAPEEVDDFDEFEFGIDYDSEQDVAFLIAIEKGRIARVLFGWTVPDNPDMIKPMADADLGKLLEKKGQKLLEFFQFVTNRIDRRKGEKEEDHA